MLSAKKTCLALVVLPLIGCPEGKQPAGQLYFKPLLAPVGVEVQIVKDVSLNAPTGGSIAVIGVVDPQTDRDELDRLLRAFYRQANDRRGFRDRGAAERIDIRFYSHKDTARAEGDDWLARVVRPSSNAAPEHTNSQKPPLLKWAKQALGPQPQYTGELKPQLVADASTLALEVTLPFVEHDGSGKYVDKLTFQQAMTAFTSTTSTLFDKIPKLRKLTFVGTHKDRRVMQIVLYRHQYERLGLRQAEEKLGAVRGKLQHEMLARRISDKAVERRLAAARRKLYRGIFARLPPQQVDLVGMKRR